MLLQILAACRHKLPDLAFSLTASLVKQTTYKQHKLLQEHFTSKLSRCMSEISNRWDLKGFLKLLTDNSLCSSQADCSMHVAQRQQEARSPMVERRVHDMTNCDVDENPSLDSRLVAG